MKRTIILVTLAALVAGMASTAAAQDCWVENTAGDHSEGSLGDCIDQANAAGGPFYIGFNIMTGAPPFEIVADQEYLITNPGTLIDGYTQPGALPNTNPVPLGLDTQLRVSVSVDQASVVPPGYAVFRIETSNVVIVGLNIHSGPLYEVAICFEELDCQNNRIQGNFLGTDISGTAARPSGWGSWNAPYGAGVFIGGRASSNTVGTDFDGNWDEAERNLISGEARDLDMVGHGVLIHGLAGSPSDNHVVGNVIGTQPPIVNTTADPPAPLPLGNNYGVTFYGGSLENQVAGNVIAGNNLDGIWSGAAQGSVVASHDSNVFYSNAIGIDPNTDVAVANGRHGVHLEPGNQNYLFGDNGNWLRANLISGNDGSGVYINANNLDSTSANSFYNNVIGLDTSAANAVPNGADGFFVFGTRDLNIIANNVISGNVANGINLAAAWSIMIEGNTIGSNFAGDTAQPNGEDGIVFQCAGPGNCADNNVIFNNDIVWNAGNGISLWGPLSGNTIGSDNYIAHNGYTGILSVLPGDTNWIGGNTISANGTYGIELSGSSAPVSNNDILDNTGWGIVVMPYYSGTYDQAGAGDDVVAVPLIDTNVINGNGGGGIISQDSEPANGSTLHDDNTIGDNGGYPDVVQAWFAAAEILDDGGNPIVSGAYEVAIQDSIGTLDLGDVPDGDLWGPTDFAAADVFTWFFMLSYVVDNAGTFLQANPHVIQVTGPTSGAGTYTFDGVNNEADHGGQPTGIDTGGLYRYQIADVVTYTDTDMDGTPDEDDCAPEDPNYQGILGVPCDADIDGYCDDQIAGLVQQDDCPNDICAGGSCTPTDCDDDAGDVNPGVVEEAFGDEMCSDGVDNDCDGNTDIEDSGCFECVDAADCDNADVCDGIEDCVNHLCVAGEPLVCNDDDPCTDDSCDPVEGCQHSYNTDPCNDDLYCTVDDHCDGAGNCTGEDRDCSSAGDQCNTGVCNEDSDACEAQPVEDGTACDDGDACTMDDACTSGECGGDPLDADDDGFVSDACEGADCDDSNEFVNPDASEGPAGDSTCSDGLDNDCDGDTDGDDSGCVSTDVCGDGTRVGDEECDDGNTDAGDGCSATCTIEAGWDCRISVEPNLCGSSAEAGDVVITEIMNNPGCVGDSEGEWIEVHNVSGRELTLRGWLISDEDSDSHVMTGVVLPDDGFAVVCRNADSGTNGNVVCDYEFSGIQLANGDDEVLFSDPGDTMIDLVAYDDGATFPDPNGASMSLDPVGTAATNDNGENWCESVSPIAEGCGDLATPGTANPACTVCADADEDGYEAEACGGLDCDDSDPDVNPGQSEIECDGKDNDCDPDTVDDTDPTDGDEDGYSVGCGEDCDDSDDTVYPGAEEICGDDIDQDCNGSDLPCDCPDNDEDGFYDESCGGTDCNDSDPDINPDADEIGCDGIDNDCNPDTADDPDPTDEDEDGYSVGCGEDCDDSDDTVYPGAEEICGDDIDQDCNGSDLPCDCPDNDEDGFFDDTCGGTDCDDTDELINPDAEEVCDGVDNDCNDETDEGLGELTCGVGLCEVTVAACDNGEPQECTPLDPPEDVETTCDDGYDNDCDGFVDEEDLDCQGCADADGDGFEDADCGGDDCDDSDEFINPDAEEKCTDNLDNDCDGLTDFEDEEDCSRGSSGCGCSTSRSGAAGLAFFLLLGLLVVGRRR